MEVLAVYDGVLRLVVPASSHRRERSNGRIHRLTEPLHHEEISDEDLLGFSAQSMLSVISNDPKDEPEPSSPFQVFRLSKPIRKSRRAARTADLLITSEKTDVSKGYAMLRKWLTYADITSTSCPGLHMISPSMASPWRQDLLLLCPP